MIYDFNADNDNDNLCPLWGQKQTFRDAKAVSALPPKADNPKFCACLYVRLTNQGGITTILDARYDPSNRTPARTLPE